MDAKEYGLTRLVIGPTTFVAIGRADYEAISEAKNQLLECLLLEDGFDLVVENYLELETTLLRAAVRDVLGDPPFEQRSHDDMNLFNRRFANLLTVCKMYRDQAPARVKRLFPENRRKMSEMKARFDGLRDSRLGYAVMEILRDDVQHAGFPVHALTYGQANVGPGAVKANVVPYVSVDRILEDHRDSRDLKMTEQLRRKLGDRSGDKLDLRNLVRDYIEGLASVHDGLRKDLHTKIEHWDAILESARSQYQAEDREHGKLPGLSAVIRDLTGVILEETQLPEHPQVNRRRLERKNRNLDNVQKVFVTSEAV